jgi:hypothetical protein
MRPIAILVALLLSLARAHAGEVIAHPFVSLSEEDIRNVYLGEKQLAGSMRLRPVGNSAIEAEFLAKVLQTDGPKYDARWIRKRFREGLTPPPILGSDAEVLAFVRATPGAIGYVSSSGDRQGLKVLQEF